MYISENEEICHSNPLHPLMFCGQKWTLVAARQCTSCSFCSSFSLQKWKLPGYTSSASTLPLKLSMLSNKCSIRLYSFSQQYFDIGNLTFQTSQLETLKNVSNCKDMPVKKVVHLWDWREEVITVNNVFIWISPLNLFLDYRTTNA